MKTDSVSNQLRWVILLLGAAVILPTVCLLWFMNQAVKNERFAIRQRLINVYEGELHKVIPNVDARWQDRTKQVDFLIQSTLDQNEHNCVLFEHFLNFITIRGLFAGVLVYGPDGQIEYPPVLKGENADSELPDGFTRAWELEYEQKDYHQAIETYSQLEKDAENDYIRRSAILGQVRCLRKQNHLYEAFHTCSIKLMRDVSDGREGAEFYEPVKRTQSLSIPIIVQSYILRAEIFRDMYFSQDPNLPPDMNLYSYLSSVNDLYILATDDFTPLEQNLFGENRIYLLHKFLELAQDSTLSEEINRQIDEPHMRNRKESIARRITEAKQRLSTEEVALSIVEKYPDAESFNHWPEKIIQKIDSPHELYAFRTMYQKKSYIVLIRPEIINIDLDEIKNIFEDSEFEYRITDSNDHYIAGAGNSNEPAIIEIDIGKYFSNWKIRVFFKDAALFEAAAKRQESVYLWTGALVAILILAAGAISIRTVNHQIKMNRLKNDFIATVTHELKTPLASMRLLVDTLLEGRYEGEQTATEYLQLVANENKRLTHLIDSFLTFSRMERNKQVFDFQPISPAEIAAAASEAMGGKFGNGDCQCDFTCTVADDLPFVSADKDGMVTVLVNLLDNAYKYTNGDKKIELKVYEKDRFVCFAVKDNGIGLSLRAQKKIFSRFYQVDSRLSRRAEGCGLGLSIVQFIVDAHKGSIEVESKPDQGSEFIVKLPTVSCRT